MSHGFNYIVDAVLLAELLHFGRNLVQIVSGHGWKEVMLDLKVEVSGEPVVEGRLFQIACADELQVEPRVIGSVFVYVHANVVTLRHPGEPGALGESSGQKERICLAHRLKYQIGGDEMRYVMGQHVEQVSVAFARQHISKCHDLKVDWKE